MLAISRMPEPTLDSVLVVFAVLVVAKYDALPCLL
jgi:hypothetical protein